MSGLHTAACFFLVLVFVARAIRLPSSFHALIGLHRITQASGFLSSLLLGVTFLLMALDLHDSVGATVVDWGIAVSSITFLIGLAQDVNASLRNLRLAFKAAKVEFGADGERMIALVTAALRRGR